MASSKSSISRRRVLRTGAAVIGGGTAALLGGGAGVAQSTPAAGQQSGNVAGRRFKAMVTRGFGPNTTSLQELRLLPISGRQVVVRTEATQCCYTVVGRMLGIQAPPNPAPGAPPPNLNPNQAIILGHGGVGIVEAVGPRVEQGPDPTGIGALQQAWQLCPAGGHICTTGIAQQGNVSFPGGQWSNGSKSHHSSQWGGTHLKRDIPRYVKLIERGLYDAKSLVTARYPLEKTLEAYEAVAYRTTVTAIVEFP